MYNRCKIVFLLLFCCTWAAFGQQPVNVGKGSYAEYPPYYKSRTDEHGGDQSQKMIHKKLYITDRMKGQPVPTNDWWTDLLVSQYSGNLWAYPILVNAEEYGIFVEYPKHWTDDGCEMKSASRLQIHGKQFRPQAANADGWHDWGFHFLMNDGDKELKVTLAHGMPFTWLETQNLTLQLPYNQETVYLHHNQELTFPQTTNQLAVVIDGDVYGIYTPAGTEFILKNDFVEVHFPSSTGYLVVGVLPDVDSVEQFAGYAYNVPRNTRVTWEYEETAGKLHTHWSVEAQNLVNGKNTQEVLQGFIPHHYKRSYMDFNFSEYEYATPRGKMKMAVGNQFSISYDFTGIIPYWPAPSVNDELANPYSTERMTEMIHQYANKGSFGADTYWGGKGLTQMALYMTFAYELGEMELFGKCKERLRETLIDWLTFTPGEENFFFARYDNWKALVGYDTSYDSETFNDHHFHYGYFTYAASLLALFDEEFKKEYGEMVVLLAKEYANWDRNDLDFPFLRTFDPWAGHSYAGGLGGWNGNGQESSSEAMQGWGGVYTLGLALGSKEIRDAGIFGWLLESRGTAEYWFDRDRENIDYTRYTKPWNSNLTSQGVGWWTWFSGDPVWMHSIQWMPISPLLMYLSEDLAFAEWDYTRMWEEKEIGDWLTVSSNSALSNESGIGNVVLSYLQIFNPDSAASVFDRMWEYEMPVARNVDTGGISYYLTHSHRTYGEIQWDIYSDIPSSTAYYNTHDGQYTYVVYNPDEKERICNFYKNGETICTFKVPARKLIAYADAPYPADLIFADAIHVITPSATMQLNAHVIDQYGAVMENASLQWSVSGGGTITSQGNFTAPSSKGKVIITVTSGNLKNSHTLLINEAPVLSQAQILPEITYLESGKEIAFTLAMKDQYEFDYSAAVSWTIEKDGQVLRKDSVFNCTEIGDYVIRAVTSGKEFTSQFRLLPAFPNIALNKPAYSSSEENAGTLTRYATDGDSGTRWGSQHADDEWLYVDLLKSGYIAKVGIQWEASYASLYEIQLSEDAKQWTTIKQIHGKGGYEETEIYQSARYVRMYGLERASDYGFSLYEFEIYGISPDLNEKDIVGIKIVPEAVFLRENESVQLEAKCYNMLGEEVQSSVSWKAGENGQVTTQGIFTPLKYGKITVTATSGKVGGEQTYIVEESRKLKALHLYPKNASLVIGHSLTVYTEAEDQFETPFSIDDITFRVVGEGGTFSENTFTADRAGNYLLIASRDEIRDTAYINVDEVQKINLALNKPIFATGSESDGLLPQYANDGDMTTRWSSVFRDNESILIDLEDNYILHQVNLFWQESFASVYRIDVSLDEEEWKTVYTTVNSSGKQETITFDPVAARYVRLTCLKRSSQYGASLWEIEVYGVAEWKDPYPADILPVTNNLVFYLEEPTEVEFMVIDQYGLILPVVNDMLYEVDGGGFFNTENLFIPTQAGDFTLTVSYGDLIKKFPFTVYPSKEIAYILIVPHYYRIKPDENLQFYVKGVDQYGYEYILEEVAWQSDGGSITPQGNFSGTQEGSYLIMAEVAGKWAHAKVEITEITDENIAYNKPVEASTGTGSAADAVDDNPGTRWESLHQDGPEWLKVNLPHPYHITNVEIDWETASAAEYEIQLSADGINWETIQSVSGQSGARTDKFRVSGLGQYIRIYCLRRSTGWGYSIIDLRVYGLKLEAGEPYQINLIAPITQMEIGDKCQYRAEVKDCDNSPVTNYTIVWQVNGGGFIDTDGEFTAYRAGEYELTALSGLASVVQSFSVSSPVKIPTITVKPEIEIKENEINIQSPFIRQVILYDLSGRMIKIEDANTEEIYSFKTGGIKGLFILLIKTDAGIFSFKVNL